MREASKLANAELDSEDGDIEDENINNDNSDAESKSEDSKDSKQETKDEKSKETSKKSVEKDDSDDKEEAPDQDGKEEDTEQSGPDESGESFASDFNPEELPDELKPAYKKMQADYTRKTQAIAERGKELERLQRFSPLIDRVLSNPQLLAQVTGQPQGQVQPGQPETEEEIPDDPKEYAEWVKNNTVQEIQQQLAQRERAQVERAKRIQDFKQAEQVDPRLNEDPKFQSVILGLVRTNQDFQNGRISATEATKQAVADYDAQIEQIKKSAQEEYKEKLNKQAKNKKNVDKTGSGSSASTSQAQKKPQSMREAWKMVQQEQS